MDSCVRRIRCLRCGCPSPDHPGANKYGGVTFVRSGVCVTCDDLLRRKGAWRSLFYKLRETRGDARQQTLTEATE
jgi:hypothetical protein